jgi:hypothetical protein
MGGGVVYFPCPECVTRGGRCIVVQITNISTTSQRLHVLAPTTPYFRMEYSNRKGIIPPGLSEEVRLFFAPTEYRYYYDCLRVRCDKEVRFSGPSRRFGTPSTCACSCCWGAARASVSLAC